jgi:hypothetical protein
MTITASVEYPAGVFTQILFSGIAAGTVPDGGILASDALSISIPNGDRFWIRMFQQCSAGLVAIYNSYSDLNIPANSFMGDAYDDSGGVTDATMGGAIASIEAVFQYHPVLTGPTTSPSVIIIGDGIASGISDTPDVYGDWGEVARTIGAKFGYFCAGVQNETAANFISGHTQRASLISKATHAIVEYGSEDLYASASAATLESRLTTIYGYLTGQTVFQTTLLPRTTSTDGWVTTGNQSVLASPASYESERVTFNTALRGSTFGPGGGVFDTGAVVETSLNSGIWVANKTTDGINPDNAGYVDIQNSGAINTALIGTVTAPSDTGSAWGDKGTFVTLSSTRRTNDTAVTSGGGYTTVRGASGITTGKKAFEIEILGNLGFVMGIINGATATGAGLDAFLGTITDSAGIASDGSPFSFVGTFTASGTASSLPTQVGGNTWALYVDATNGFAYLMVNGVMFQSGDPTSGATGTGHVISWDPSGTPTLYPGFSWLSSTNPVRLRTANLLYSLPSGYTVWG